jgi:putative transposase
VRQGCNAMRLERSSFYKVRVLSEAKRKNRLRIIELSQKHPRYGYRRITVMMKREAIAIGRGQVQRVRRQEGLQVRKRQRKMR